MIKINWISNIVIGGVVATLVTLCFNGGWSMWVVNLVCSQIGALVGDVLYQKRHNNL